MAQELLGSLLPGVGSSSGIWSEGVHQGLPGEVRTLVMATTMHGGLAVPCKCLQYQAHNLIIYSLTRCFSIAKLNLLGDRENP
jgi:hypothetical protein